MTTYSRHEIVTRRVEYGVEAGADMGAFGKVQAIAYQDYCHRKGLDANKAWTDDWATVEPRDEETVIRFQIDHAPDAAEKALDRARAAYTKVAEIAALGGGSGTRGALTLEDLAPIWDALSGAGQ